ncbi:hypothetical protein L1987_08373 [Smallanthus sonchifolius]|uniref:Uncharacterized protein n=1 Tax=Smallanthus sonchifolius TaxID=185202 RepID=A0ACB9JK22_9ASTR|nr:hypothetical protein L1987_08373 [Smallanthus sonchifolius]
MVNPQLFHLIAQLIEGGARKKKQPDAIDEVEELLKLTQDDLLLKLTVNSHIKSKSDFVPKPSHSNAIDPDLDRRFQALRSKPNPKSEITADHDDLFARFAALKAPNATSASISTSEDMKIVKHDVEDADEEDEVQKIINWAIDAARLDPSPSSEIDDDDDDDSYSDDDDSDDGEATSTVARKKLMSEDTVKETMYEVHFDAVADVDYRSL